MEEEKLNNIIWSPTLIRFAHGCIRRFWKTLEMSPIETPVAEFIAGKEAHDAVEQYLATGNESYIEEFPEILKMALDTIRATGPLIIEKEIQFGKFRGIPDVVIDKDNEWIVIDIKTRFESKIEKDDYNQLYFYLFLLQSQKEKEKARIGILSLWNQFTPLVIDNAQFVSFADLTQYVNKLVENAKRSVIYGRYNTYYCRYCNYVMSCDYKNENEPKDIQEVARQYMFYKSLINKLEDQLKEFVNASGENIKVDGLEIGMHIRNKTVVDTSLLTELVRKHNIDINTVYKPHVTGIKKLAKKIDDFSACVSIEQEYYFGVKAGDKEEV